MFAWAFAHATPLRTHVAYVRWMGEAMLSHHAIPGALGAETFTAAGTPYIAAGWLGFLTFAILDHLSSTASPALQVVLALATVGLIAFRSWRTASQYRSIAFGLALVLSTLLVSEQARMGGELWAWFLGALLAILPVTGDLRSVAVIVAFATIVWSNVSELGVLAPIVVFLTQWSDGAPPRRALLLGSIALVATMVNPAGFALLAHASGALEIDRSLMLVRPQLPSYDYPATYRYGLPVFVAATALASWFRRNTTGEALAIAVSIVAILGSGRFFTLAALLVVPVAARSIAAGIASYRWPRRISLPAVAFALVATSLVVSADYRLADLRIADTSGVPELAAQLDARPGPHRVLCLDQDGDACDAFLPYEPHVRTFIDERVSAYPPDVRARKYALSESPSAYRWLARLKGDGIDALVVHRGDPRASLAESRAWKAIGSRGAFELLART